MTPSSRASSISMASAGHLRLPGPPVDRHRPPPRPGAPRCRQASMAVLPPPTTATRLPISGRLAHGNAPAGSRCRPAHPASSSPGQRHAGALPRADGDDGRIVLLAEVIKGNVLANADVVLQLDARPRRSPRSPRSTIAFGSRYSGNAVAQHTAHLGHGVHRPSRRGPCHGQVISRRQATGTAADDCQLFCSWPVCTSG